EGRAGGRVFIRHPNGVESAGEVVEITPPRKIVFTYGFVSGQPMPPGASRVSIRLDAHERGTELHLVHEFAEPAARDEHVQGWRYQLAVFGNVVADEANAGAAAKVDGWFEAWSAKTDAACEEGMARIAAPGVRFRDRFSLVDGMADLLPHLAAARRFMPGLRLVRAGDVRHCQGTVLADWVALAADGQEKGRGTNVFVLDPDGRIQSVTGFWGPPGR
ncbi:MAG TPA: SRPBCC domain-containing protein, partial [Vicinamibacteria bacterium]